MKSVIPLAVCLACAFGFTANAADKKIDPTGAWKWSTTNQNGQVRESTLTLKFEGEKLTGAVVSLGRGGQTNETAIADAKLAGEDISFTVTREFGGNKFVSKYAGKVAGETIKGKMEFDRGGQKQTNDWEAKREATKPKAPAAK